MSRRLIYCVPLMECSVARRLIYCVPLMEDRSGPLIYLLCALNERSEWLVDLSIVCPSWKIGVARRFIYFVPLMEDKLWLVELSIVCP